MSSWAQQSLECKSESVFAALRILSGVSALLGFAVEHRFFVVLQIAPAFWSAHADLFEIHSFTHPD